MIFPTVVSSSTGFAESPDEDSLVPEDFSTLLIQCSLKSSVRIFVSVTGSSLASMLIWSSEKHPLFVRKGFSFLSKIVYLSLHHISLKEFFVDFLFIYSFQLVVWLVLINDRTVPVTS